MNRKIILASITAMGILTSSFAVDITYYGLNDGSNKIKNIDFSDVSSQGANYWAKPAIYQTAAFNIMNGIADGLFSPTTTVTNEQAIVTLLNANGKSKEIENMNIIKNSWSDKYIKYAMNEGLITEKIVYKKDDVKGDVDAFKSKGIFIRDIPITREEMATLLYRTFGLSSVSQDTTKKAVDFIDKDLIDSDRTSHVDAVSMAGIMTGDESGMFNPKSSLTRAELAQVLKNSEEYFLANLHLTKFSGFIDSISATGFNMTDEKSNSIEVRSVNRDVPVIRNNNISGISALRASDEIDIFVNSTREVVFIRVKDDGTYEKGESTTPETISKQGIVTGNSPYFYEISIKDKDGNSESYTYGLWTKIYKDNKETNASNILQGDTVYLEFDEIGNLVVIRGVTNTTVEYGTITKIDKYDVSLKIDGDSSTKKYNLKKVPVYKEGLEINATDLNTGEYMKLYLAHSELTKVEIVSDERTAENLYKGYISEINLIQDRITLKNPKVYKDNSWQIADSTFITIPLDSDMKIYFDGDSIEKTDLGEKQVGKFAYIATREDTKVLERAKAITIELNKDTDSVIDEIKSYSESSSVLRLCDDSRKIYINESTICVLDGKIVESACLEKGSSVFVTLSPEDSKCVAKMITSAKKPEIRDVTVYYGTINELESGESISIKILGRYEDDAWYSVKKKYVSLEITDKTRIYSSTEPLTFKEFDSLYEGKNVCVIAYNDEAISINLTDFEDNNPYISIGSVENVTSSTVTFQDVEHYDFTEEEWVESNINENVGISLYTLITVNGNFAKSSEIEEGQEIVVIRKTSASNAAVMLLTD